MVHVRISTNDPEGAETVLSFLPFPKHFDANEWFIIAGLLAGYGAVLLLKKQFPLPVSLLIILFGITVPKLWDATLAVKPFELYDINDYPMLEMSDVFLHLVYGPFAYMFVYVHCRFRIKGLPTVAWIIGYSLLGVGMEWIGALAKVYTHKQWNYLYSFFIYGCLQGLLLVFYRQWLTSYIQPQKENETKKRPNLRRGDRHKLDPIVK